ncbi:MAG: metalloregulator ArsR/SmtB family transcription factor [Chloroflexota bacterium]|nr:metalloregulator ArsR/SmtB family transcription factor [Chloroflexota bacterium]
MARPRKYQQLRQQPELECDVSVVHFDAVQIARSAQPSSEDLAELSSLLALIADPTRLRIVAALAAAELCVCDLSATIGISESAISHHLRSMRDLKVVRARRDGRLVFYSLDDDHVMSIYRQAREHVAHRKITGLHP